jgi:hypothetical protein
MSIQNQARDLAAERGTPVDPIPADAALALANALLLIVAPGRVTSIETTPTEIRVRSSLASPFSDRTPSLWLTVLDRVDGHTVSCEPTQTSQPRCSGHRPGEACIG